MKWFGRTLVAKSAGSVSAVCFLGKLTDLGVSLNDVGITILSVALVQRYRKRCMINT